MNGCDPLTFVLPGLLAGTAGVLLSPAGAGKSTFALQLALDMASGAHTLGLTCGAPAKVVFLSAEDPSAIVAQRLTLMFKDLTAVQAESAFELLQVWPVAAENIDLRAQTDDWPSRLAPRCEGAALIVVDALNRLHSGGHDNANAHSGALRSLEVLASRTGAGLLALMQMPKTAGASQAGRSQAKSYPNWLEEARWVAQLTPLGESEAAALHLGPDRRKKGLQLSVAKANYGPSGQAFPFHRSDTGRYRPIRPPENKKLVQRQAEAVPIPTAVDFEQEDGHPTSFLERLLEENKKLAASG
jgi:RecA-family ATPase